MSTTRNYRMHRTARNAAFWRVSLDGSIRFVRAPICFVAKKAGLKPSLLPLARPRPLSKSAPVRRLSFAVIALLLLALVGSGFASPCPLRPAALRPCNPATTGGEGIVLDDCVAVAPALVGVTRCIRLGEAVGFSQAAPSRMQASDERVGSRPRQSLWLPDLLDFRSVQQQERPRL
jgi:hypothetical protein